MNALQLLAVILALIAALSFGQAGRLLGAEAKGWPDAPIGVFILFEGVAVFWLGAMVHAFTHPGIVSAGSLALAAVFAGGGLWAMNWVLRRRPHRRRLKRRTIDASHGVATR